MYRWFGGRRVIASNWNGKDKFEVKETAEQEAERLRKWDEYLETGGEETSSNTADGDKSSNNIESNISKQTSAVDEAANGGSGMDTKS